MSASIKSFKNKSTERIDYYIENCPLEIENVRTRYYLMGEYIDIATRGIFKVRTHHTRPFALGEPENMIPLTTPEPENVTGPVSVPENVTEPVSEPEPQQKPGPEPQPKPTEDLTEVTDDFYENPDPPKTDRNQYWPHKLPPV